MQSIWSRLNELAGPQVSFPSSEADLIATMPAIYQGFDEVADLATLLRSTLQGRQVRLSQRQRQVDAYSGALADSVKDLPVEDRLLATAMVQVLHTTPWLEMRDHWGLDGARIARACGWAVQILLKDLRVRGDRPLADGPV